MGTMWMIIEMFLAACLVHGVTAASVRRACPCDNPDHCQLVTTKPEKEILAFCVSNKNYLKYDWTKITLLVGFEDCVNDTIMCYAHSKGVKVTFGADYPFDELTDPDSRSAWVAEQLETAENGFMDGINVDFESVITEDDSASRDGLNALMDELWETFKSNGDRLVTFDTPPNPTGTRHYDFEHIASKCDFVAVMSYDLYGPCDPGANSHFRISATGLSWFGLLDIPAEKMLMAIPWYGYNYPCSNITNGLCDVSSCGRKDGYDVIHSKYLPRSIEARWDRPSSSPCFNYLDEDTGELRQVWYDNPLSLRVKYAWAVRVGLRGVGMWHADYLIYDDSEEGVKQQREMWGSLPDYKK